MKSLTYSAIFALTTFATLSPGHVFSQEIGSPADASVTGFTFNAEEYHAWEVKQQNEDRVLPSLDYWGLGKLHWGSRISVGPADQSSVATMIAPARDPATPDCLFAGLKCEFKLMTDGHGNLVSVRRIFLRGNGKMDRRRAVAYYKRIKSALEQAYNAPSHNLSPEDSIDGKDAYVSGLVNEYFVKWQGPETIVSLRLSERMLALDFAKSPSSSARLLQQRAARAEQMMMSSQ